MTLSTIIMGIAIVAASAWIELSDKEYEEKRKVFENEN